MQPRRRRNANHTIRRNHLEGWVQNVANLPTLDEARAKIVGILATPASKFVSILLARSEKMSNLTPENSEKTT